MNRRLHLARGFGVADPDHAVARLPAVVKNSDYIAGAEFGIETEQEGSTQADVASADFLQKALPVGVDSPNCEGEVGFGAWFAAALGVAGVGVAEILHG